MVQYLFPPEPVKAVPVIGEAALYPVRRIFCVGRNYVDHAREMGLEVDREAPFYFTKSPYSAELTGGVFPYPPGTTNFHYEMELVVAMGADVFRATRDQAAAAVYGYGCGLDMTRRDLQLAERSKQRPWDTGKDVEHSAILAPLTKAADFGAIADQAITLDQNGTRKQQARLSDMVWKVDEIIAHLSGLYHLGRGDLIFTGTPAGVGPVVAGDVICGQIQGLAPVTLTIA